MWKTLVITEIAEFAAGCCDYLQGIYPESCFRIVRLGDNYNVQVRKDSDIVQFELYCIEESLVDYILSQVGS